ncbi:MAG: VOC family protein [Phycisphaerales bacterium]|nr:VOC family protein [Phycisphaerales bacterium]
MSTNPPVGLRHNISFITLGVRDLAASRLFYATIGLEEHPSSNDHVAFFDMSGQVFALFQRDALAEDATLAPGLDPDDGRITFALAQNVREQSDIAAVLQRVREAGGRVLREPSAPPWGGIRAYFADPDGFAWEVAWNPHTRIDDAGRVHLGGDAPAVD